MLRGFRKTRILVIICGPKSIVAPCEGVLRATHPAVPCVQWTEVINRVSPIDILSERFRLTLRPLYPLAILSFERADSIMKKTILLCIVSGFLGAMASEMIQNFEADQPVAAQEQPVPRDPTAIPAGPRQPNAFAPERKPQQRTTTGKADSTLPGTQIPAQPNPQGKTPPPVPLGALTAEEQVNIGVYETANRGVVNISTKSARTNSFFFAEAPAEGSGSGSVLDKKGHILTNYHVIDGAQSIEVTLATGNTFDADVVGHDLTNDIAVLKIDAPTEELYPLVLGESGNLRVGQRVFAIGNPFGLERTLTVGILSSLNRSLPSRRGHHFMKSIIQVDAAMNPGNSGGPLIDSGGRVIGMNTAIASKTGQNTGVGFAIPVNRIKRIVPELIAHGRVARAELGLTQVMVTERGLLVAAVTEDGPAEKAGLQGFRIVRKREQRGPFVYETRSVDRSAADLITHLDGEPVSSVEELLRMVEEKKPGQQVELTVIRDNSPRRIRVTLGEGAS